MFNLFGKKELDSEKLVHNVTEAVLGIWDDKTSINIEKFFGSDSLGEVISQDKEAFLLKLLDEKVKFISCVAVVCLEKEGVDIATINKILKRINERLYEFGLYEKAGFDPGLEQAAGEYARIRTSGSARKAGKAVEEKFTLQVFGRPTADVDTDGQYAIYKSLSSLERAAIFKVKRAINSSLV